MILSAYPLRLTAVIESPPWDTIDYGTYHVLVQPDQVFNLQGNAVPAGAIGSFQFDPAPWQHRPNRFDVDASGFVTPLDVLIVINEINRSGSRRLDLPPAWQESPPPYFDVNGDNWLTPLDALLIINHINARSAGGGEAEAADTFWSHFGAERGRSDLWSAAA